MSDQQMAHVARSLAVALDTWARTRSKDDLVLIAQLHTSLCKMARDEEREVQTDEASSS